MSRPRIGGEVLVVGAGVTGLATALALRSAGAGVTLVERRAAMPRRGLGLNLPGNAVRALAALGRADEVRVAGVQLARRDYRTADGRRLFTVDESEFWSGVGSPVAVRHGDVVAALARDQDVRFGVDVVDVDTTGERPRVRTSDGDDRTYDLVLGADGIHSRVRASVTDARPRGSSMTASAWRFVTANPGVEGWSAWNGHGLVMLLLPVSPTEVYGYAASNTGRRVGADPQWLLSAYERFPGVVRDAVRTAVDDARTLRLDPVEEVRADRWHRGRVGVLGDAAHATGPVWAQGAAMGLEDALVLAEEIVSAGPVPAALAGWEARRRSRVGHVQAATDRMSRMARTPDVLSRFLVPFAGPRTYRAVYGPLREPP